MNKMNRRHRRGLGIVLGAMIAGLTCQALLLGWCWSDTWFHDPLYSVRSRLLHQRLRQQATPGDFKVYMLGSSKAQLAFSSSTMEHGLEEETGARAFAFNFGNPGTPPALQWLYLRRLLQEDLLPDLLLLEVSLPLLDRDERYAVDAQRLRPDEKKLLEGLEYRFPSTDAWEAARPPWYHLRHHLVAKVNPRWNPRNLQINMPEPLDSWGDFVGNLDNRDPDFRKERLESTRLDYWRRLRSMHFGGPQVKAMTDMISLCKQQNISVAFVVLPEGPLFQSWYDADNLARNLLHLRAFADEQAVTLVDARQWLPDEDCYLDSHHMEKSGAERFTRRLVSEFVAPWARQRFSPASSPASERPIPISSVDR